MIPHAYDARLGGTVATLLATPPAAALFRFATQLMRDGFRGWRAFRITGASYAAMLVAAGVVAFLTERPSYVGEALMGAVMGGGGVAPILFLTLLRILTQREAT